MPECEHRAWVRVDDDAEGDYDVVGGVRTIAPYMECVQCGERREIEPPDEED